jgi:hypothetical protein
MASVPLPVSWEILGWVTGLSGDLLPGPQLVGRRSVRPPTPPSQKGLFVVAVICRKLYVAVRRLYTLGLRLTWVVRFCLCSGDFNRWGQRRIVPLRVEIFVDNLGHLGANSWDIG